MPHSDTARAPRERAAAVTIAFLLGLSGCATASTPPSPGSAAVAASAPRSAAGSETTQLPPKEIHWFQSSAEYQALARQSYALAEARVRELAAGRARGSWAVILDGDETVVDNSEYQRRLAERGEVYATATWHAWVRERRAGAVPGAREFLAAVASLGGRIFIVTNRDMEVCEDTRANMRALSLAFDGALCRTQGVSDKNPRFQAVANGTAVSGIPALDVILWVGDNIQDFPTLTQAVRTQGAAAFGAFGRTYIMLPNPMYGSWESNPAR
jgi:5'-nucleotidase (lipoprotein e(P4) family)